MGSFLSLPSRQSEVRYGASVWCRVLVQRGADVSPVLPIVCLNRHYVAEGPRLRYSGIQT